MDTVKVVEIRKTRKPGPLRAFADIEIGDVVIKDFRVMQDNGRPYVKAPFSTYRDKDGEMKFRQIVILPDELRGRIDNLILSEYYLREKERQNDRPIK